MFTKKSKLFYKRKLAFFMFISYNLSVDGVVVPKKKLKIYYTFFTRIRVKTEQNRRYYCEKCISFKFCRDWFAGFVLIYGDC